ncbi:MAG: YceH family protein [Xanthomonadales bacterium]|nr:YceH family protein [Xanthomonadales bacterium]
MSDHANALTDELTDIQARILGCLIEKEGTTPDQYPLSLNALKNACNQKSNRFPVVNYYEGEIGQALRRMYDLRLVSEESGARTPRYRHHAPEVLGVLKKELAVLCVLMLRGPQTPGEIRGRCHRLFEFDDTDDVVYVLQRLMERDHPYVMQLPRQPGQKEERYAQLLCGEPDLSDLPAPAPRRSTSSELEQRVEQLEEEVARLKQVVQGWLDEE